MKKSNLIKVVTILLISVMVMSFATIVNAANEDDGFESLTHTLLNGNNTNNSDNNTNIADNNTNQALNNTNTNNVVNNTNNSSVYNNTNTNTNLPKTGIEDSIPVAMLVVVFGISAVYAYKKVNDYKNI